MQTENQLVNVKDLPNLHKAQTSQRELSSEYWTPENDGEYKVGVIVGIKAENYTNEQTGEVIELPCMLMLSQNEDGSFNTIRNGAKRLVATIENAVTSGEISLGQTPVKIEYKGKTKNKTNQYLSDRWSIKPIILA